MISVFLRKAHISKTQISLHTSVDSGPIRRARARRRQHMNPPTAPIERARCKSRKCIVYLVKFRFLGSRGAPERSREFL